MSRKPIPTTDDLLDAQLDDILKSGWDDAPAAEPSPTLYGEIPPPAKPKPRAKKPQANAGPPVGDAPTDRMIAAAPLPEFRYPPLPVKGSDLGVALLGLDGVPAFPEAPSGDAGLEPPQKPHGPIMDIGLLSDLASGRKGALEAADAAGVTEADIQSALATALHDIDPKEILKALGMQAAEQQLKSGALYGVVLHDLVQDIKANKVKAETKVELLKLLANVGRVMPKEDKTVSAGNGFVLNINLSSATAQPVTIVSD